MGRKAPNEHLRALLWEAGWSAETLARSVNVLGASQGLALQYDRSSVAHWLAGVRPRPRVSALIAEVLTRRLSRLLTPADIGVWRDSEGPAPRPLGPAQLTGEALVAGVAELSTVAMDAVRHPYQAAAVYPLLQVRMLVESLPRLLAEAHAGAAAGAPGASGAQPGSVRSAEQLCRHEAAAFFQRQAETRGGGSVRGSLAAYVRTTCALAGTTQDPEPGLAALTAALAWTHADDGAPGVAWALYEHALHLSLRSRDRPGAVRVLEAMGAQALDLGHPAEAVALSEAADLAASGPASDLRPGIQIQLAAALAATGRTRDAARVRDLIGRRPAALPGPAPASAPSWSPTASARATWHRFTAQILTLWSETASAINHLRLALRHSAAHDQRTRALTHAHLCRALLAAGRTEAACRHGHQACDLGAPLHSSAVHDALTAMAANLAPHFRVPEVRRLGARLAGT